MITTNFLKRYRRLIEGSLIVITPLFSLFYCPLTRSVNVQPPDSINEIDLSIPVIHPLYKTTPVKKINELRDVNPVDWYYEDLRSLSERYRIVYPYKNGTFSPEQAMTRAELIYWTGNAFKVFYSRLLRNFKSVFSDYQNPKCFLDKKPTLNNFILPSDVKTTDWYYPTYEIVAWITDGDFLALGSRFRGTESVTRAEMVIFINRFLNGMEKIIGKAMSGCNDDTEKTLEELDKKREKLEQILNNLNRSQKLDLSDSKKLSQATSVSQLGDISSNDYFYEDLRSLVERYGCMVGLPNRNFEPNRFATRAEVAAAMNACLFTLERIGTSIVDLNKEFHAELDQLRVRLDRLINDLNRSSDISQSYKKQLEQLLQEIRKVSERTRKLQPMAK